MVIRKFGYYGIRRKRNNFGRTFPTKIMWISRKISIIFVLPTLLSSLKGKSNQNIGFKRFFFFGTRAAVRIIIKNTPTIFQRSVDYKTESGEETTVGSLLSEIFPKIKVADKWEEKKNTAGVYIPIIQGIRIPLDTKISFAYENLSNFDGFLYLSLV